MSSKVLPHPIIPSRSRDLPQVKFLFPDSLGSAYEKWLSTNHADPKRKRS